MTHHPPLIAVLAPIGTHHAPFLKTQKRLNEPNSENANQSVNIDDFTNFAFFKK
jgi:hypothetical protein